MDNVKTESTIVHIIISVLVGLIVMYFTVDFSAEEGLNQLMDSVFWLAFVFTFFSLRYWKKVALYIHSKFQK